jgi:hypothetical protein
MNLNDDLGAVCQISGARHLTFSHRDARPDAGDGGCVTRLKRGFERDLRVAASGG